MKIEAAYLRVLGWKVEDAAPKKFSASAKSVDQREITERRAG